jgi:protein required for attachment to host cells
MKSSKAHLNSSQKYIVLVAHQAGAHFFSKTKLSSACKLIESVEHPAGRLKNQDINADRPGRSKDRFGGAKHSYSKEFGPSAQKAKEFSKILVQILEVQFRKGAFDRVILVAPAHFLGLLNAKLTKHLKEACDATFSKDFAEMKARDIGLRVDALTETLAPLYRDMPLRASR